MPRPPREVKAAARIRVEHGVNVAQIMVPKAQIDDWVLLGVYVAKLQEAMVYRGVPVAVLKWSVCVY